MSEWGKRYSVTPINRPGFLPVVYMRYKDPDHPERSLEAGIAPAIGSTIFSFKIGREEIVDCVREAMIGQKADGPWQGIFTLAPFMAGRQRNRQGKFDGQLLDATRVPRPVALDDNALVHGIARAMEWSSDAGKTSSHKPVSFKTTVRFGKDEMGREFPYYEAFPYDVGLTHEYVLNSRGLRVYAVFENYGDKDAPIGHSLHANLKRDGATKILVPAQRYLPLDSRLLPILPVRPQHVEGTQRDLRKLTSVDELRLDDFLTDLSPIDPVIYDPTDKPFRVKISGSTRYKYCVVFTGMNDSVSIELQTHSPDPLTLHERGQGALANIIRLKPGGRTGLITDYEVQHCGEAARLGQKG